MLHWIRKRAQREGWSVRGNLGALFQAESTAASRGRQSHKGRWQYSHGPMLVQRFITPVKTTFALLIHHLPRRFRHET